MTSPTLAPLSGATFFARAVASASLLIFALDGAMAQTSPGQGKPGLTGSIGMVPSSSLGEGTCGLYEPIHGSAPDIAGQDVVNPIACILSAAMMLRYSFGMAAEADAIESAVNAVLDAGLRTADMMADGCTKVGCTAMGDAILERI